MVGKPLIKSNETPAARRHRGQCGSQRKGAHSCALKFRLDSRAFVSAGCYYRKFAPASAMTSPQATQTEDGDTVRGILSNPEIEGDMLSFLDVSEAYWKVCRPGLKRSLTGSPALFAAVPYNASAPVQEPSQGLTRLILTLTASKDRYANRRSFPGEVSSTAANHGLHMMAFPTHSRRPPRPS